MGEFHKRSDIGFPMLSIRDGKLHITPLPKASEATPLPEDRLANLATWDGNKIVPLAAPQIESDDDLREALARMRAIAQPVGPMHAFWEVIFDVEAHLAGKPEHAFFDREKTIGIVRECLARLR